MAAQGRGSCHPCVNQQMGMLFSLSVSVTWVSEPAGASDLGESPASKCMLRMDRNAAHSQPASLSATPQ